MKKLFLTGIAALFLTTGTAHAQREGGNYMGEQSFGMIAAPPLRGRVAPLALMKLNCLRYPHPTARFHSLYAVQSA
jgi:hypothetical protein